MAVLQARHTFAFLAQIARWNDWENSQVGKHICGSNQQFAMDGRNGFIESSSGRLLDDMSARGVVFFDTRFAPEAGETPRAPHIFYCDKGFSPSR